MGPSFSLRFAMSPLLLTLPSCACNSARVVVPITVAAAPVSRAIQPGPVAIATVTSNPKQKGNDLGPRAEGRELPSLVMFEQIQRPVPTLLTTRYPFCQS